MTERATTDREAAIDAVAKRHGFSSGAMLALAEALRRGGGRMAQFSHPELGGMGQWSGTGLLQIGAMSDHALKARVAAALADLAAADHAPSPGTVGGTARERGDAAWWPPELGRASASGAQDGRRYAWFARTRRLAIVDRDRVTVYDTAHHRIAGVSQSRSRGRHLAFTTDEGTLDLDGLRVVGSEPLIKN